MEERRLICIRTGTNGKWQAVMTTSMTVRISKTAGDLLVSRETISFSNSNLFH